LKGFSDVPLVHPFHAIRATIINADLIARIVGSHLGTPHRALVRRTRLRWAVAKLVRHQALDLAFEGSNPSRPARIE
jgi:hypothetical protein